MPQTYLWIWTQRHPRLFSNAAGKKGAAQSHCRAATRPLAEDRCRHTGRARCGDRRSRKVGKAVAGSVAQRGRTRAAVRDLAHHTASIRVADLATTLGLSPIPRSRIALPRSDPDPHLPVPPGGRITGWVSLPQIAEVAAESGDGIDHRIALDRTPGHHLQWVIDRSGSTGSNPASLVSRPTARGDQTRASGWEAGDQSGILTGIANTS